jgi:hypothetical protein
VRLFTTAEACILILPLSLMSRPRGSAMLRTVVPFIADAILGWSMKPSLSQAMKLLFVAGDEVVVCRRQWR